MPKTKPMSPEVRDHMRRIVAASAEEYFREMTKRNFKHPETAESRTILLEGICEALHNLTRNDLTGHATILAFAHQLLEKETT